jgi:drug/metabolite transporter (DMT)-like permease
VADVSPTAITLVLVAAIAHASWNLFSKQAASTGAAFFIWLISACVTVGYAPVAALAVILGHAHLTALSWVFMVGTGVLQSAYFLLLQIGYSLGDLSVVYPVGRGTGAMLAAIGGIVILSERPSAITIAGIAAIVAGVVAIGLPGSAGAAKTSAETAGPETAGPETVGPGARGTGTMAFGAVTFALATGVFIASYTIWDKYAVASLHTPPILQGYACYPVMTVAFAPFVLRDRPRLTAVWRTFRPQVFGAALLAPLAYILVLTALRFTAVSAVAPAREVSVLFGVLLGRRLLGEGDLARRLAAATAIVAGIIAIAVG